MRKFIATAAAALMLASGLGVASAGWGPPSNGNPNHPAWFGLCTAHSNNSDQGKNNGQAFQWLRDAAEAQEQTVEEFCADKEPGGGAKGGNGNGNGNG